MGRILALAGVNGAGKSSLLGTWLDAEGLSWFNPDSFTRRLVDAGWPLPDANAEAWQEGTRRLRQAMADGTDFAFETTLGGNTIPRLLREACERQREQYTEETEQLAASQHGEDDSKRMQSDFFAHQTRYQYVALDHLADDEHAQDQNDVHPIVVLDDGSDKAHENAGDAAQIRHEADQSRDDADQRADIDADGPQRNGVQRAERQHHG